MRTPLLLVLPITLALPALADAPHSARHGSHAAMHAAQPARPDTRETVVFPPALKAETLANMRDHLLAIQEITAYLADKQFDAAADLAETRLGMSSLQRHGAHEVARHMPMGMRQIGHGMHQAASRFATAARDAGVTGDTGAALRAFAGMQSSCVACHAAYQLQ